MKLNPSLFVCHISLNGDKSITFGVSGFSSCFSSFKYIFLFGLILKSNVSHSIKKGKTKRLCNYLPCFVRAMHCLGICVPTNSMESIHCNKKREVNIDVYFGQ